MVETDETSSPMFGSVIVPVANTDDVCGTAKAAPTASQHAHTAVSTAQGSWSFTSKHVHSDMHAQREWSGGAVHRREGRTEFDFWCWCVCSGTNRFIMAAATG